MVSILVLAMILSPAPGAAQTSQPQYAPWQTQAPASVPAKQAAPDRSQQLVDRLRDLIKDAERARAADPRFLGDLRALARTYDQPWRVELLNDDFRDGDYWNNPAWTVADGRFEVEWGVGLRSVVKRRKRKRHREQRRESDDLAAILGTILSQDQGQRQPRDRRRRKAEIFRTVRITNPFAISVEINSRAKGGRFSFGPYSGDDRKAGYRLVYVAGSKPRLELRRLSEFGAAVIEARELKRGLEDQKTHLLEWTRHRDGEMVVVLDGESMLSVSDRSHKGAFDGFTMVNLGGDYGVRSVRVRGTRKRR
ncbi:MAG: hypothetical protein V3T02_07295 [Alphaproteobacteria bacterium]